MTCRYCKSDADGRICASCMERFSEHAEDCADVAALAPQRGDDAMSADPLEQKIALAIWIATDRRPGLLDEICSPGTVLDQAQSRCRKQARAVMQALDGSMPLLAPPETGT